MSRRESRASLNVRQNDALFEFENFKKKFLLANKHITKLNSTLSVRIEELNAQISTLYVENLRLRASEIALAAQLKREREKSSKVIADAEAATLNLTKHLNYLRQSLNIKPAPSAPPTPSSPRAQKPIPNPHPNPNTPILNRISRPPNFPGIYEEEEPCLSSDQDDKQPSSVRSTKTRPRLSASKLPLPARVSSPVPLPTPAPNQLQTDLATVANTTKRKTSRRQSGLLTINTDALSVPRAASPAFGSPIRLEAGRAEEEEERAASQGRVEMDIVDGLGFDVDAATMKEKRRSKTKERKAESEEEGVEGSRPRDRKRQRETDDGTDTPKLKLQDVTNSRMALQPIDNTVHEAIDVEMSPVSKTFLANGLQPLSQPTSRGSPSPAPLESDGVGGGRERRVRKSVNYAEPKLNTKMRKPDPPPGSESSRSTKKRSSAAAILPSPSYNKYAQGIGSEGDNDMEARSSAELPLRVNGNYINPELFPLPPSRPGSATTFNSPIPPTARGGGGSSSSSSSNAGSTTAIKRKKSRPRLMMDDEEDSDGAQADAEYVSGGKAGVSGWVNVEGRRKAGTVKKNIVILDNADGRRMQDVDGRRHSLAV